SNLSFVLMGLIVDDADLFARPNHVSNLQEGDVSAALRVVKLAIRIALDHAPNPGRILACQLVAWRFVQWRTDDHRQLLRWCVSGVSNAQLTRRFTGVFVNDWKSSSLLTRKKASLAVRVKPCGHWVR